MKKAAIITLYGNSNYGNKLQNYAVQEVLKEYNLEVVTIKNRLELNNRSLYILRYIKYLLKKIYHELFIRDNKYTDNEYNNDLDRTNNFLEFDKKINTTNKYFNYIEKNKYKKYDYYCVGSDQIWNPNYGCINDFDTLGFVNNKNKFSLAASIGVDNIDDEKKVFIKKRLADFKGISVREDRARDLLSDLVDKDIFVSVDPTMLLSYKKWNDVIKKPIYKKDDKKFILLYFLGNIVDEYKSYIEKIAKEYDLEVINILDKSSDYYKCGPSEFLWLEKNADIIFTDSFHSCVFSIIFNNPFLVFDRKDKLKSMNSRINTLLNKFKIKERKYTGDNKDIFNIDYTECNKILLEENKKTRLFLDKIIGDNNEE